jgi:aspartyl-tRNA(Asn)/glutamyl-tRNA(Gln) amidotransferase subunit A
VAEPYAPTEDAVTLSARIRRRELTATEAVAAALDRVERLDGQLKAFCTLAPEQALADAATLDRRLGSGDPVGPLAGVPLAVKDLISTKGLRTTFGSRLYADNVPGEDDVVVERLRAAGAIVIGKTNTSEFGYGAVGHNPLFSTTRNPWDPTMTPGGSSAGSAVAVAAGMVSLSLGSDGGGSVRVPASLTGTFGIKPSWGRVPVYPGCRVETDPGASGWESLEHIGPITRTVEDAALMLSVLSGPSPKDRHSLPHESIDWTDLDPAHLKGKRIAFTPDLGFADVDPEIAALAETAAHTLAREYGAELEIAAPAIGDVTPAFQALVALDTDRNGLRRLAPAGYVFTPMLQSLLDRDWTADEFTAAILARKRVNNIVWRFMERYDLLLTPGAATAAFPIDSEGPSEIAGRASPPGGWTPFSFLANLTGQPAASVPAGFTAAGLPAALQIIGRHQDDLGVLQAAAGVERALPWRHRWPEMLNAK